MASEDDCACFYGNSALFRLSELLRTGDLSDVTFVVGGEDSQKEFRAHKLILSTANDVFRTMFYGSLPERETPIEVPDLHPDGFDAMLKYVYGKTVFFRYVGHTVRTVAVANKYLMDGLKRICYDNLVLQVTPDVACCMYEVACLYDLDELKRLALTCFILNTKTVINDKSFLSAQQSTVQTILCQDTLSVPSERQLFDAVLRWGKAKAIKERDAVLRWGKAKAIKERDPDCDKTNGDIRAVVDPLLPYIRFLSMSSVEFCEGPAQSDVLTDGEIAAIVTNINCPGSRPLPPWVNRKILRNYAADISVYPLCTLQQQYDFVSNQWGVQGEYTVVGTHLVWGVEIILKKNLPDKLIPVSFTPQQLDPYSVVANVSVSVYNDRDCKVRLNENGTYTIEKNGKCRVKLKNPVAIFDGKRIVIDIKFEDNVEYARCKSLKAVSDTPVLFRSDSSQIHALLHTMFGQPDC